MFRQAEDSEQNLARSIDTGRVWVARAASDEVIGHAQAVVRQDGAVWEVVNMAVAAQRRGAGTGRRLLEAVIEEVRQSGAHRLIVATAAADTANLRFYQRCGFRMSDIVRDAFSPETGYPEPIMIDGIPLCDQVWFDQDL